MQNEIIERLTNQFARTRSKNPAYSLRAFAKRVGVQPSALSEILNGKRVITKKMGQKVLSGLGTNPTEIESILGISQDRNPTDLSLDYFKAISDWFYFAILSLAEIPEFKADPEWISKRLNISKRNAKMAIARLIDLGMLVQDEAGSYQTTSVHFKTPTDILDASLKNHTVQTLELAANSIVNDPVEKRDFSTVTMAIDPSKIDEAKKLIRVFRKRLARKLESGNKKEVYKLAIQLFPLSHNMEKNHA